jgi:DNA polymerase I-like protein with 3'-5' exonuclease and polymerase domains
MRILFLGTKEDESYLHKLKPFVGVGNTVKIITELAVTLTEIVVYCRKNEIDAVATTQAQLIEKLTGEDYGAKTPSLDNYAGSYFIHAGIQWLFIHPLAHTITVPFGNFLLGRYLSKLVNPSKWYTSTPFSWEIANESTIGALYERFEESTLLSVDIETRKEPLSITCIGYCALFISPDGQLSSHSIVIPFTSQLLITWAGKFNRLAGAKVLQNGKYDVAYLSRYGITLENWYFDTATMHHSWYSELPKDLGAINAFYVRDARYWKHEAGTAQNLEEYYLYNAKDTHATLNAAIAWMLEAPSWARKNYIMEFPLVYPCHLSEMTGLKRDMPRAAQQVQKIQARMDARIAKLRVMTATPNFNPNSPKQVGQLLKVLGCEDITSTKEQELNKASFRHPLNERILGDILEVRGDRKLLSTYFGETVRGYEPKEFNGRILYTLNPHGTDTGRLASMEHHFWCGLQLQNIPRGDEVKCTLIADDGFFMGEADYAQAESRDTAYITGDANLIAAVEGTRDFHSINASAFFGIPYELIYSDLESKTLDKKLRDLAKRTNHGASYCMGDAIMLDTMGIRKVLEAQRLLGLSPLLTPIQVTGHLLSVFAKTYPVVAKSYPEWVVATVLATHMLVGPLGWTRYCFKNPSLDKRARNSYVAHNPQSHNAMTLNKAFLAVFYKVWLPNQADFKLYGQIHDSILFGYRHGHEHLAQAVKDCMEFDVPVVDISGMKRILRVPVDLKLELTRWDGE